MVRFLKTELSIKTKIFIYLISFCSFLIILLWFLQNVFLDKFYKEIRINEIEKVANIIENNLNKKAISQKDLELIVDEYGEKYNLTVEVKAVIYGYNSPIKSIYQYPTNTIMNQVDELIYYYLYQKAFKNDKSHIETIYIEPVGERIFLVKIVEFSDYEIIIFLSSPIFPVDAMVNTLRAQLIFVTVCMVFFSLILAFLISRKISNPIVSMNNSAKKFANGNYDIVFDAKGYKEIYELSNTLNYASTELLKVDSLRKELIANISHDLRTPLTLISGYAEAMRDLPGENNEENAQVIIDESKRLSSLVKDVLDLSKFQSGNQILNKTRYNLTQSISNEITRLNELIKKDGYFIYFNFDKEYFVNADCNKISQVLYNLLINAINHSSNDKNIVVDQIIKEDCVVIEVIDKGDGIKEEDLPYVWERYYKTKEHHKRGITGSGIGLSIVKEIINSHNGKYGVESKFNEGSKFWFSL